jgi:hypothetical protein
MIAARLRQAAKEKIMTHGKHFIPDGDAAYDKFFKNICRYVNQKITGQSPEWTHIP